MAAASILLVTVASARPALAADSPVIQAWTDYYGGKSLTARRGLEAYIDGPGAQDLAARRSALEALLEICIHSLADECVVRRGPEYAAVVEKTLTDNPAQRIEAARRAGYYIFAAQLAHGSPEVVAGILQNANWKLEQAYDGALYLRRRVLAAEVLIRQGKPVAANREIDKILSLIASADNPRDAGPTVAWALSEVLEDLLAIGDVERAHGLFRAVSARVGATLPPLSVDAVLFALRAGTLLQVVGRPAEAQRLLDAAVATIDRIELEPAVRSRLLSAALTDTAALCAAQGDATCAREALDRHPFAELYAGPGRAPASIDELKYLTVRAIAAGYGGAADPVVVAALDAPLGFTVDDTERGMVAALRDIGVALAAPSARARSERLLRAGRGIREAARQVPEAPFGAWYRSSVLDQTLFRLALTQAEADTGPDGADAVFTLVQLTGRTGWSFDADALTVLGQARDGPQRRAIHQALRLRARRDALERDALRKAAERLANGPATGGLLSHDYSLRMRFRDFANRIAEVSQDLDRRGVAASGINLVSLKQLQSVLAPDEAALAIAPTAAGLVYMCVRHDSALRRVTTPDLAAYRLDMRLMQAALTAGHAPSETLDSQFPVASAVRLHELLIRPFEPCLKSGDHIVWLSSLATTGFPLQALLERAPPKTEVGWDLSQAAWLVRSHAVTYAGAASTVVAARTARRTPPAFFDFLGVGDPALTGVTTSGEARAAIVTRGLRAGAGFTALAPLPETREELERSARGFAAAKILTGDAATEAEVRRQVIGAYRYLSFATHGLLRDDIAGLSEPALVLTPVTNADSMNDGLLTASEIADLNLAAAFVALSACNTANFDVSQTAQDLPALASAFAVAGVRATLGTLWPVESETGKQVVAGAFERLRDGQGASAAVAEAQRAFLAAPPTRAHLHPRFWSPFVVMGDGGAAEPAAAEPGAVALNAVDMLNDGDGEVLAIRRREGGVLAHSEGAPSADGVYPGVTTLSLDGRQAWRRANAELGAGPFLLDLGPHVLVGGAQRKATERWTPVLEALDSDSGAPTSTWRAEAIEEPLSTLAAGVRLDAGRAAVAAATLVRPEDRGKARPKLHVFEIDGALTPRRLFTVDSPSDSPIAAVTLAPLGTDLLVTYAARDVGAAPSTPAVFDEFDVTDCQRQSLTRVELRDLRTGALKAAKDMPGYLINAAAVGAEGRILLGGSYQPACGQARAVVAAADERLSLRTLYQDATPGASAVRTLSALADGRVFVAASKDNTVDFGAPLITDPRAAISPETLNDLADKLIYSGMLLLLDRQGEASPPAYLNAGISLYVTASDTSRADDILLGGGIDDTPAIFHLAAPRPRAAR